MKNTKPDTAKNPVLSIRNLKVNFRVRNRILNAIRNVSFDLYEGEILAIVGESGSGKSVITKTFTGMLDSNGWISDGTITYLPTKESISYENNAIKKPIDIALAQRALLDRDAIRFIKKTNHKLIHKLNNEKKYLLEITSSDEHKEHIANLKVEIDNKLAQYNKQLDEYNLASLEFDKFSKPSKKIPKISQKIEDLKLKSELIGNDIEIDKKIKSINSQIDSANLEIAKFSNPSSTKINIISKIISEIEKNIDSGSFPDSQVISNMEDELSKIRYFTAFENQILSFWKLLIKKEAIDANEFSNIAFNFKDYSMNKFFKNRYYKKIISEIRGKTIATIFQDPMTSLNPLLSVGFQISEVLIRKSKISRSEAKVQAIKLLEQVGITNAHERYRDIPGRYSGGMRQRVVIAIALACKPQILICDEPTTALDVTIQAQILRLIKKLQTEYKFSTIFITHDLGVVANIADRVAVMYAGQVVEIGTTHEIFNDARHPYTWALLLSLPQLGTKGEDLYSIGGTPPSLFNEIEGDAFAPRNKYALAIDYIHEPPMFKVSETHYAKTWLLHKKAPKDLGIGDKK